MYVLHRLALVRTGNTWYSTLVVDRSGPERKRRCLGRLKSMAFPDSMRSDVDCNQLL